MSVSCGGALLVIAAALASGAMVSAQQLRVQVSDERAAIPGAAVQARQLYDGTLSSSKADADGVAPLALKHGPMR
jgi:hypothetical protein